MSDNDDTKTPYDDAEDRYKLMIEFGFNIFVQFVCGCGDTETLLDKYEKELMIEEACRQEELLLKELHR